MNYEPPQKVYRSGKGCFDMIFIEKESLKSTNGVNQDRQENPNQNICPKLVGGIGKINFGSQFRQGNRVCDSEGIAMCCCANSIGNAGGHSYLYLVEEG